MDVTGEVHCTLTRGGTSFELDALVVRQLEVDILAGNPFMVRNDVAVRPARREIFIGGSDVVHYGKPSCHTAHPTARRTQSFLLRCPQHTVVFPVDYVEFATPAESDPDSLWALEPRLDSPSNLHVKPEAAWPQPQDISSIQHADRISNTTNTSILLKKREQVCQSRPIISFNSASSSPPPLVNTPQPTFNRNSFSNNISVDPDQRLPDTIRSQFHTLHLEYDYVFNPAISK